MKLPSELVKSTCLRARSHQGCLLSDSWGLDMPILHSGAGPQECVTVVGRKASTQAAFSAPWAACAAPSYLVSESTSKPGFGMGPLAH